MFAHTSGSLSLSQKYAPFPKVLLPQRRWPSNTLHQVPIWCSVDLRDGNQALPIPMSVNEKLQMYKLLLSLGFKEIEVGYPSASETEFIFIRRLVEENLIPPDVTLQVITPCRRDLIQRSFQAIAGVPKTIMHFLNATSTVQRQVVFHADRQQVIDLATDGAACVVHWAEKYRSQGQEILYEYSPESFTGTELDFALAISEAVLDTLGATWQQPAIINLPATVEMSLPNIYADQIEWFCNHTRDRSRFILSIHPHNDRGTGVAAAELALLAGADRVEGTLFGNGERTGNVDLVTLALNLYTQGIDPGLDFSNINQVRQVYEENTRMKVPLRQPYVGELVYTAFSGSHQDAIRKGLAWQKDHPQLPWQVPYLPIDPADLGRQYEPIIRINSQSGKGGAAYIMESDFGYRLPKAMHPELGQVVKEAADGLNTEITGENLLQIFREAFILVDTPYHLSSYRTEDLHEGDEENSQVSITGLVDVNGQPQQVSGLGNGPLDALYNALKAIGVADYEFISYDQHALSSGSDSRAIAYIQLKDGQGRCRFGVGASKDIKKASLRALISAINRMSRLPN